MIREYYSPQVRSTSGGGPKNFNMVLENGEVYACYDTGKGLLAPGKHFLEARTEMRGPVSSFCRRERRLPPVNQKLSAMLIIP